MYTVLKTKWFLNAKVSIYCDLPLHIFLLFWGDCLEVFFSNILVYYTRLPSVLPRVLPLDLGCPLFLSLSR